MIKYDTDGVTLVDSQGAKHGPMDPLYSKLSEVLDQQDSYDIENTHAVNAYNAALNNAQISINIGRGSTVTVPTKPLKHVVVDDTGKDAYVPFDPPLADIQQVSNVTPTGSLAAPSVDKLDIVYNLVKLIYKKVYGF
jgi:hypothetical protein